MCTVDDAIEDCVAEGILGFVSARWQARACSLALPAGGRGASRTEPGCNRQAAPGRLLSGSRRRRRPKSGAAARRGCETSIALATSGCARLPRQLACISFPGNSGPLPRWRGTELQPENIKQQWNREARPSRDILGHTSGSSGWPESGHTRQTARDAPPGHVNSSSSAFASLRSGVSKPSVNQP